MSASAASTPGIAPKTMTSRLLTMKFMQRAANSSPPTPDEPASKRRRTEVDVPTPTKGGVNSLTDRRAIQAALASEEAKRQAALDKQAEEAGDTKWELSFREEPKVNPGLRVVYTGFAALDSSPANSRGTTDDDAEDAPIVVGRRSFGKFNKVVERQQNPTYESSEPESEDDDEPSSEEPPEDDDDAISQLIQDSQRDLAAQAKINRKRARNDEAEKISKRRKGNVNLNHDNILKGLTSLSGRQEDKLVPKDLKCFSCGGNHYRGDCPQQNSRQGGALECYNCGGNHRKVDCDQPKRRYDGDDNSTRPHKSQKAR